MTKSKSRWAWLMVAAAAALGALGVEASAATTAVLNIDVQVTSNLSVNVNGFASSTDTLVSWNTASPNAKLVSPSSSTVTNDSGAQTEKWALSTNATSIDQGSGGAWTLAASTQSVGADAFGLQAVFGSSRTATGGCPNGTASDWDQSYALPLTASPQTYTSALFADANLNQDGDVTHLLYNPDTASGGGNGRMLASSKRALCWRIVTPQSTSSVDTQNVQVIVTAQNP